ncbi:MAG: hypothetical protein H6974_01165 [Gammaproteobacteria bacterium]|nr:hypothetical protein [Gammaproteobacteria bacterium]MCP5195397.1 hypothetical protein [Gammaproteobacteria bacterium]
MKTPRPPDESSLSGAFDAWNGKSSETRQCIDFGLAALLHGFAGRSTRAL